MVFSNQNKAEVTKWVGKLHKLLWSATMESLDEAKNLIFSSIGGRVDQVLSHTSPTFTKYVNDVYIALGELEQGRYEKISKLIDKNVINAVMNTTNSEIAFYIAREESLRANAQKRAANAQANAARRRAEQAEANARRANSNARARRAAENARAAANAAAKEAKRKEQEARALAAEKARLNATKQKAKEAENEAKKKARAEANAARQHAEAGAGPSRRQSPPAPVKTNASQNRTLRNQQNRAFQEQIEAVSHWRQVFKNTKTQHHLTTRQTIRRMARNHLGLNLNRALPNSGNVPRKTLLFLIHPNRGNKSVKNKAIRQVLMAELT